MTAALALAVVLVVILKPALIRSAFGVGSPAAGTPASVPAQLQHQELDWRDCPDDPEGAALGAECAQATVPLDYADPSGETISIALKRIPALDGDAELGPLLINPGGPGGSGVDHAVPVAAGLPEDVLMSYDIVGFDPRGLGQSTHLNCWSPEELEELEAGEDAPVPDGADRPEELAPDSGTGPQELTRDDYADLVELGGASAEACREYSQVPDLIDHMSTIDVVHDLDLLRAVFGQDKLNYLGYSYGTTIGALYADLFPSRVGRFVLDGATDPSLSRFDEAADQHKIRHERMSAFIDYCLTQERCPLSGTPQEAGDQLLERLQDPQAAPIPYTNEHAESFEMTMIEAGGYIEAAAIQLEEFWPALVTALSQLLDSGDGTLLYRLNAITGSAGTTTAPTREEALSSMVFDAVTCADDPDTGDPDTWLAQDRALIDSHPLALWSGSGPATTDAFCHGWDVTAAQATARLDGEGAGPILVIGATGDPNTPYQWAQAITSQLTSAHLLTVEANWHTTVGIYACATDKAAAYLLTGEAPADGEVCGPEQVLSDGVLRELEEIAQ